MILEVCLKQFRMLKVYLNLAVYVSRVIDWTRYSGLVRQETQ